ncbi:HIT-like domain-containing protein [Clohesyomyces aquaticus]|uniref:HIT-like domain-containing protein n=1 Tax=Clohesyomyces aquaticus TaxID=1231657 RepID=A0A1Y1ZHF4_9PLEO|nr:HIT-like domain-containing protein [Clohesyomyces aquaticus]
MTSTTPPDIAAHVESLIPKFQFTRLLNQDQAGRRISLLGTIDSQPAVLLAERAAFATDTSHLNSFSTSLSSIKNLGANDIYSWFLANISHTSSSTPPSDAQPPDLKLNLIYPCTSSHIKKYSRQGLRIITETPAIYSTYIRPYMLSKQRAGALNWVYNILDGRTEQDDIIYRSHPIASSPSTIHPEAFLLLPDLNWDRLTLRSLHLLALPERRDILSVRDLTKAHLPWLRNMRAKILAQTVELYRERGLEEDMLKLYVHYQPTYYHFHVHVVHVELEAGGTQATGKALGLENVMSTLEAMEGDGKKGMSDVDLTYHLGEASELWEKVFLPLKEGRKVESESQQE